MTYMSDCLYTLGTRRRFRPDEVAKWSADELQKDIIIMTICRSGRPEIAADHYWSAQMVQSKPADRLG